MLIVVVDPDLNIKTRLTLLQVMFFVGQPYLKRNLIFWSFPLVISVEVGAGKGCGVSGAQNVSDFFRDSCLLLKHHWFFTFFLHLIDI